MPAPDQRGWFSVKTAAYFTSFSESAIESAIRLGRLQSKRVRLKGRKFARRIKREALDAWIENDEEAAAANPGPAESG